MKLSEPKRVDYCVVLILLCWMWSMPCLGGAENTTTLFLNTTGDGLWGTAANWSLDAVPTATSHAVINNGRIATVAANSPSLVDVITVGNDAFSNTALHIEASLSVNTFRVDSVPNAVGHVQQINGWVTVSKELQIAATDAGADTGTYMISGGRLSFSRGGNLTIGTQGQGRFTINGSSPAGISGTRVTLGSQGTLEFRLGMLGVTPLSLTEMLTVRPGGQLVVDGSAYEGLDGYLPLIKASGLIDTIDANNVTFVGLEAREPAVVVQDDGLWLRLLAPASFSEDLCSLVPDSTVAADYNNTDFSVSRALASTGSAWWPSFHEAQVMDTRLTQDVLVPGPGMTNRSWTLTVGRGGQIASLRTPALGETTPPQWRNPNGTYGPDMAPWVDDVWQGVAVDTVIKNATGAKWFIHQAGVYMRDPIQKEPFFSPQVAAVMNPAERSFTTINWGQQAHSHLLIDESTENDFQSHLLYFTRFRDLGQGLIEVSLGLYNYGPDLPNHFNMPWGGVRQSSLSDYFLSGPEGRWSNATPAWGEGSGSADYAETGGWMAFCDSTDGSTPALVLVFGHDATPLLKNQTRGSYMWWKHTDPSPDKQDQASSRNYGVFATIRRYNLHQGSGVWARYYFVLGDDVADVAARIADRGLLDDATLIPFDYTEDLTPLVGYRYTGSGTNFRIAVDSHSPQFFLYAHPVNGSFPI